MDFTKRKEEIISSESKIDVLGNVYYISNSGSDENDGKSEKTPIKSISKLGELPLT